MSGKRLLDAIQLFNAAKSVASKHIGVRQRQLDVFTRTSSLTKGIKGQVDGLVLTAQAAAALTKRFNEPPSPPAESNSTSNVELDNNKQQQQQQNKPETDTSRDSARAQRDVAADSRQQKSEAVSEDSGARRRSSIPQSSGPTEAPLGADEKAGTTKKAEVKPPPVPDVGMPVTVYDMFTYDGLTSLL